MNVKDTSFTESQFWQAFEYVAGDLSPEDSEAFELRLLDDVPLCEAVAAAVQMTSGIAACKVPSALSTNATGLPAVRRLENRSSQTAPASRAIAAMIATSCCCLLLAFVLSTTHLKPGQTMAGNLQDADDAEWLVSAWAAGKTDEPMWETDEREYEQELDVPEWMLAAVSLPDADTNEAGGDVDTQSPLPGGRQGRSELF